MQEDKYLEKHYFVNQKIIVEGIPVNPLQREYFDMTDNEEREELEVSHWWGKPYIVSDFIDQESYIEHYYRLKNDSKWTDEKIGTKEDYELKQSEDAKRWFESYPTGHRYIVRCLDGGAWDRSTRKGDFSSFDEALNYAKTLL